MKKIRIILSLILTALMLISFNSVALTAYAAGTGTESNPYQVSSAAQLQNINDNLSAYYKLTANIDLSGVDFTPIGNADSGAFSGCFDGNGYTISNLNIFAGKYAGLFGYNEGTVKNVKLENIYVYGSQYVGGVVAYNSELGVVSDCSVTGGSVESDGGLDIVFAGGICGYSEGTVEGYFFNSANVITNVSGVVSVTGGIIGRQSVTPIEICAENSGTIYTKSYDKNAICGGIIASNLVQVTINNSSNSGTIELTSDSESNSRSFYAGGFVGYSGSDLVIYNSSNYGSISSSCPCMLTANSYCGGIVGYANNTVSINKTGNSGSVYSFASTHWASSSEKIQSLSAGLIAQGGSRTTIMDSYNVGIVDADYSSSYAVASRRGYGLIGYVAQYCSAIINNSFSSNNLLVGGAYGSSYYDSYAYVSISNSYCYGTKFSACSFENRFKIVDSYCYDCSNLTKDFTDFDFDNTWEINENINSGLPFLKSVQPVLMPNYSMATLMTNETLKLVVYKDGVEFSDVSWSKLSDNVSIDSNGVVTAEGPGTAHIIATDSEGNVANCFIYCMSSNTSVSCNNFSVVQGYTGSESVSLGVGNSCDYLTSITSSDEHVLRITSFSGVEYSYYAVCGGTATVTFTTKQGKTGSCTATVTNELTKLLLDNDRLTIECTLSASIGYSVTPNPTSTVINWTSSDESVATVNQQGVVTGVSPGTVTITATPENGVAAKTCTVTVKPLNYLQSFTLSSTATVARGTTAALNITTKPENTSTKINWTSADESVVTVDENGNVTGVSIGSAVITATPANGIGAKSCTVTVNAPVTAMEFEKPSVTVYVNDTPKLNLIVDPADTTESITYSSSSSSNCPINSSTGVITAKSTGTYTITATSSSGIKAYCTVKVISQPVIVTGISLNSTEINKKVGETYKLTATVTPSNATDKTVSWASTDESVATVTNGGMVEAVGAGKAVVTATTENGIVASCVVNVTGVASTNQAKIYIPDMLATNEDYVNIPVMLEGNPGISFATFTVEYDKTVLEANQVNNGDIFGSVLGTIDKTNGKVKLVFLSEENITADGILAAIKFKVLKKNTDTSIRLSYFPADVRNSSDNYVSLNIFDGKLVKAGCSHDNTGIINAKDATCEQAGYTGDVYCYDCNEIIETGNVIPALGHDWGAPTYTWSDDLSTCTARRTCSRDASHIETETVYTVIEITREADYYNSGEMAYIATFENEAFATQTETVEIPMLIWAGFPDVHETDWFYDYVKYCAIKGYVTGFKDGTFGPNKPLTRQDFVVILARIAGADLTAYESIQSKMPDVIKGSYYAASVNWAVDNGIIGGYTSGAKAGKFGVGDSITREQVCTILYRYMGSPAVTGVESTLKPFADANRISSFAKDAVVWAIQNGVISGKNPTTLAPIQTASRAEIATIIMRMDVKGMFDV